MGSSAGKSEQCLLSPFIASGPAVSLLLNSDISSSVQLIELNGLDLLPLSDGTLRTMSIRMPSPIAGGSSVGSIALLLESEMEHHICSASRGGSLHMAEGCPPDLKSKLLALGHGGECVKA